jgi:hypothetical protein
MSVSVGSGTSSPYTGISTPLKVKKGTDTIGDNEEIISVANESELDSLDVLPATVNQFSSASYGAIADGTVITITCPEKWQTMYGTGATLDVTMGSDGITVTPALPGFANQLAFFIGGVEYTDGLANRDYVTPGFSGDYFLSSTGDGVWESVPVADNRYQTVQSSAQWLVDALNTADFIGSSTEVFS